jgi:two-component system, OmpR family, sensor histidine kinase PrrB
VLEQTLTAQVRLVALLDALQALARGDAGASLPRERLDFAEIVDAAVEAARRRHEAVDIVLDGPQEPQPVAGWPDGLRLLVDNLLENAVRHGGPHVKVALTPVGDARELMLSVDDDGPGVPEHERGRIFERFERGRRAQGAGSGLGLALAAQQASLHGGEIELTDSPLGGARFSVRLPADSGHQGRDRT